MRNKSPDYLFVLIWPFRKEILQDEKDFIEKKGDAWIKYRDDWEQFSKLEKESNFPPHLEFELNYSCNLKCNNQPKK